MNNDYHPKAALSLFLNQAEHNLVNALKEVTQLKKPNINELSKEDFILLENKYFRFLRLPDNSKVFEHELKNIDKETDRQDTILKIKRKILKHTSNRLNAFRNFYSHFYHRDFRF